MKVFARVIAIVFYGLLLMLFYKQAGFEYAVLLGLAMVLGNNLVDKSGTDL